MIKAIQTAISGLMANQVKAHTSAKNIANAQTVNAVPEETVFTARDNGGVEANVIPSSQPFVPSFEPGSPFANADGYVSAPSTNILEESFKLSDANLAFEANAAILSTVRDLSEQVIDLTRRDKS